jgi:hypothetical protein
MITKAGEKNHYAKRCGLIQVGIVTGKKISIQDYGESEKINASNIILTDYIPARLCHSSGGLHR